MKLEYKVGIFVGLGLIASMVCILILGGNKVLLTRYTYFNAHFEQVQGLFPGSVVSLAGVPVGNVKKIGFSASSNALEVLLQIDREFAGRVVKGSTVEIRTQGALGDKYVYLEPGPPGGAPIADGETIPVNDSGDILKMLSSKDDGVGKVLELIKEMHILVATLNSDGRAAKAVDNISQLTVKMTKTLGTLDTLLGSLNGEIPGNKKLKTAVESLASILMKIDEGKGTLGQLINDPSLHQSLKALMGGSSRQNYLKNVIRDSIQQNETAK